MPMQAISSIHKAKGLECEHSMVVPCDDRHFSDNAKNRCLLYVALNRASRSLTLVVSRATPQSFVPAVTLRGAVRIAYEDVTALRAGSLVARTTAA